MANVPLPSGQQGHVHHFHAQNRRSGLIWRSAPTHGPLSVISSRPGTLMVAPPLGNSRRLEATLHGQRTRSAPTTPVRRCPRPQPPPGRGCPRGEPSPRSRSQRPRRASWSPPDPEREPRSSARRPYRPRPTPAARSTPSPTRSRQGEDRDDLAAGQELLTPEKFSRHRRPVNT